MTSQPSLPRSVVGTHSKTQSSSPYCMVCPYSYRTRSCSTAGRGRSVLVAFWRANGRSCARDFFGCSIASICPPFHGLHWPVEVFVVNYVQRATRHLLSPVEAGLSVYEWRMVTEFSPRHLCLGVSTYSRNIVNSSAWCGWSIVCLT